MCACVHAGVRACLRVCVRACSVCVCMKQSHLTKAYLDDSDSGPLFNQQGKSTLNEPLASTHVNDLGRSEIGKHSVPQATGNLQVQVASAHKHKSSKSEAAKNTTQTPKQ